MIPPTYNSNPVIPYTGYDRSASWTNVVQRNRITLQFFGPVKPDTGCDRSVFLVQCGTTKPDTGYDRSIFWYNAVQSNRIPDMTDPCCCPMWYVLTGSRSNFWSSQTGYRIPRNPMDWIENWTNPDENRVIPDKFWIVTDHFRKRRECYSAFDAHLGQT